MHHKLLLLGAALLTAACDDPYATDWDATVPDTAEIYSLSRPEHVGLGSVFDVSGGTAMAIESMGTVGYWDFGFVEDGSEASFLLGGAIPGFTTGAIMQPLPGYTFDEVARAPAAGYDSTSVPLRLGTVYVMRTHATTDIYGSTCRYYAKLEPIALDTAVGRLRFRYIMNPNCESRDLRGTY